MQLNHYTDVASLLGIIKPNELCMHATRFSHLNDSQEYRWISEKIAQEKQRLSKRYEIDPDEDNMRVYPYVLCFCDLEDEALMWRLYGRNGQGFMIELDYEIINDFSLNHNEDGSNPDYLHAISYGNEKDWEQHLDEIHNEYCKKIIPNDTMDLEVMAAFVKRDIFKCEKEIRYMRPIYDCFTCKLKDGELIFSDLYEDPHSIKHRVSSYGLTPYIDITFPKEALKKIIVGYNLNFEQQESAIRSLLDKYEYSNVETVKSKIKM